MASYLTISNVLWAAQPVLQGAVIFSLWRKKLHKAFPYFVAYLATQALTVAILLPIYTFSSDRFYQHYWYSLNWAASLLEICLAFKVLHEIFTDIFRPFPAMKDLGTILFRWGALVMLLVGVVVAASAQSDSTPVMEQVVVAVQRCVRLAQVGLVLFLLSLASHLGIRWRHRSFGLALGFGFLACAELLVYALLLNGRGFISPGAASLANMMAYNFSILIWFSYCWMRAPEAVPESTRLKTQRWDRSLGELQFGGPQESLIPMFEDMVERALARSAPAPEPSTLVKQTGAGA